MLQLNSHELWSRISDKVFVSKNYRPIEIYRQLCNVYGYNAMNEGGVRQWLSQNVIYFLNSLRTCYEYDISTLNILEKCRRMSLSIGYIAYRFIGRAVVDYHGDRD